MKTKLIFLAFIFMTILNIKAQCNPTITSPRLGMKFPDKILFCNTETEILSTQTFGSYQWYKQEWTWQTPNNNPWTAIPGAISQTLTINGNDDQLYYFKVEVTQGDCTAASPVIMADGFAYGLPAMISTFTPGTFTQVGDGEFNICAGASVKFDDVFPDLYGIHTWYKCIPSSPPPSVGDPCVISGATGDSYTATESGEYGFYACTEYCPDQCEFLGTGNFIKLNFGNWEFCTLGTGETKPKENSLKIYPNPTSQFLYIGKESDKTYQEISIIDMSGKMVLQKSSHRFNEPIDVSRLVTGNYIILSKDTEGNTYKNKFIKK
ncbi:putative secreted protein (Por secretion system target) [Chryseobacterium sp. 52]|uniref:T9SS type A sorting domain-containing protein n=1 Tax=Chryseobacterium sp. 52 TaxID=2035213 RepID=UPI000C18BD16|nr:T9SS type A sorting domain-containing protein [Chryseobacterium sp. 52]PIF43682.1 putative secreted protein (Por secretion system target) [Chryseobacterium sp. 52]